MCYVPNQGLSPSVRDPFGYRYIKVALLKLKPANNMLNAKTSTAGPFRQLGMSTGLGCIAQTVTRDCASFEYIQRYSGW